jgi:collagenase-like PrtC family protease
MNANLCYEQVSSFLEDNLNEDQKKLYSDLEEKTTINMEDLQERIDDVKKLIDTGIARLRIVQSFWGVEFLVELAR